MHFRGYAYKTNVINLIFGVCRHPCLFQYYQILLRSNKLTLYFIKNKIIPTAITFQGRGMNLILTLIAFMKGMTRNSHSF